MIAFIKKYDFRKGAKGIKYVDNNTKFSRLPRFYNSDFDRKRITLINRVKSGLWSLEIRIISLKKTS